jgi:molybdopterin synthase catalytic subunit
MGHELKKDLGVYVAITSAPIDVASALRSISSGEGALGLATRGHGGQNFFLGRVRAQNHGKNVVAVSYDAFEPLACRVFETLILEARAKWGQGIVAQIVHRVGRLEVGEVSVWIGVSAPHRDEAYQASRYLIEQIKLRAPVWKKEHYENGETEWLKGHALCGHAPRSVSSHDSHVV